MTVLPVATSGELASVLLPHFGSDRSQNFATLKVSLGGRRMLALPTIDGPPAARRLPSWLKRTLPGGNGNSFTQHLLEELRLETVCENARCPNQPECWSRRTA